MIHQVDADKMTFLFWTKEQADNFLSNQSAAWGGTVSETQILGTKPKCKSCTILDKERVMWLDAHDAINEKRRDEKLLVISKGKTIEDLEKECDMLNLILMAKNKRVLELEKQLCEENIEFKNRVCTICYGLNCEPECMQLENDYAELKIDIENIFNKMEEMQRTYNHQKCSTRDFQLIKEILEKTLDKED